MIVDENLKDCTDRYIKTLEKNYKWLSKWCWTWLILAIITTITLIAVLIQKESLIKDNKILKEQLYKDETELALEHSIGYWFINKPEEINDSLLYAFLKDNNAWYPDILLKQAKLESGNYTSDVYKNTNNPYGMKKAKKRKNLQIGEYKGFGKYTNWCVATLCRVLWDYEFFESKPSREEYIKTLGIYAEDTCYLSKIQ